MTKHYTPEEIERVLIYAAETEEVFFEPFIEIIRQLQAENSRLREALADMIESYELVRELFPDGVARGVIDGFFLNVDKAKQALNQGDE